jgi:hypothetical protein
LLSITTRAGALNRRVDWHSRKRPVHGEGPLRVPQQQHLIGTSAPFSLSPKAGRPRPSIHRGRAAEYSPMQMRQTASSSDSLTDKEWTQGLHSHSEPCWVQGRSSIDTHRFIGPITRASRKGLISCVLMLHIPLSKLSRDKHLGDQTLAYSCSLVKRDKHLVHLPDGSLTLAP